MRKKIIIFQKSCKIKSRKYFIFVWNYPLKACWNNNFWASIGTKFSNFPGLRPWTKH